MPKKTISVGPLGKAIEGGGCLIDVSRFIGDVEDRERARAVVVGEPGESGGELRQPALEDGRFEPACAKHAGEAAGDILAVGTVIHASGLSGGMVAIWRRHALPVRGLD